MGMGHIPFLLGYHHYLIQNPIQRMTNHRIFESIVERTGSDRMADVQYGGQCQAMFAFRNEL
jgi:hypothetical protein